MDIPYRRIRTDISHLYYYGCLEILLGLSGSWVLQLTGWQLVYVLPVLCCFSGKGTAHVIAGVRRRLALKALGYSVKFSVTMEQIDILKKGPDDKKTLYLGEGFTWGPEHTQAFHELSNMQEKALWFEQQGPEGGLPYIHNIGTYLSKNAEKPQIHVLPEHTAIIGSTGVGKTRAFELVIAQLVRRNEPVIIIDPKSDKDLLDITYQCCMAEGCTERFEYFSLAHPQVSAGMNPFANFSTPGEIAGRITSIMPNTGNSQPFIDFCYDVLSSVANMLILINREITLQNLYKYTVLKRQELVDEAKLYRAGANLPEHHARLLDEAIEQLEVRVQHDSAHFQKMTTSLLPVLGSLSTGNVGAILSPRELTESLSWERILREKSILYMSLASMRDTYLASNVGKLFVQDFVSYIGTAYTRLSQHESKHLIVDEAPSVIYEGYVDITNKCRAAGVHLYLGLQTTADIEAMISDPVRRQMYGLLANRLYMRILDTDQTKELAETLGTCMVPKATLTRNVAGSLQGPDLRSGELYRSGFAERVDMVETDLLPKPLLSSLPMGQAVLVTQGFPPIKLRLPLVRRDGLPKFSFFEQVAGLYRGKEITLKE